MSATVKVGAHGRNAGWWRVRDAIAVDRNFTNSNRSFRGERVTDWRALPSWPGQLPEHFAGFYQAHRDRIDYVIYSYETPIAWHVRAVPGAAAAAWYYPSTRYSVTTSRHQSQTHVAIAEQPASSVYTGHVVIG